jgi:serine/threonine-protein kinase HipA
MIKVIPPKSGTKTTKSTSKQSSTRGLSQLDVYLNDKKVGLIEKTTTGKQRLVYDDTYVASKKSIPISLSLPATRKRHDTTSTTNFMWGLLPDNALVLQRWGVEYGVSPNNPFGLLAAVGEDCPGAIQLLHPGLDFVGREGVAWITDDELKTRIRNLKADPAAARQPNDTGRISLPGAQTKTALYRTGTRWGVPKGRTPTTHILKPEPIPGLAANEHFTLLLMRSAGLPTAESEVLDVDGIPTFVTKRYDRFVPSSGQVRRIHQEDMCQALGIPPSKKYQADGGPGIPEIMSILRHSANPQADRDRFMRAQAFNMIVGNGDAHAKNYSILYAAGGAYRLSPFYDVICLDAKEMAMTIGGQKKIEEILPRHWEKTSQLTGYDPEKSIANVRDLVARLPGAALGVRDSCAKSGVNTSIVDRIIDKLWCRVCTISRSYGAELMEI